MRYLRPFLMNDLERFMVLLSGPRQSGKTTLAKDLIQQDPHAVYLNWDLPKDRRKNLAQEWAGDASFLVFDEIHKKRQWKNLVKGIYDTKASGTKMLVTGSARLEVFTKSGDSMFGRYRAWRMHPFCLAEDPLRLMPGDRLKRLLSNGGFPFPYLADSDEEVMRWRNQRWELLLREDLRDLENIKDIQSLELLAEILRRVAGGLVSYANLAEDVEKSPKTIKAWIGILEKLYLIYLLTPYSRSVKRALSKTPKLYFLDTGDLGERDLGVRIENLVAMNLLKRVHLLQDAYGDRITLHFVRDKDGNEVDFLIAQNRKPVALIEVKSSLVEPHQALRKFKKELNVPYAYQLHAEEGRKPFSKDGVIHEGITEFFSQPLDSRRFWEFPHPIFGGSSGSFKGWSPEM